MLCVSGAKGLNFPGDMNAYFKRCSVKWDTKGHAELSKVLVLSAQEGEGWWSQKDLLIGLIVRKQNNALFEMPSDVNIS